MCVNSGLKHKKEAGWQEEEEGREDFIMIYPREMTVVGTCVLDSALVG